MPHQPKESLPEITDSNIFEEMAKLHESCTDMINQSNAVLSLDGEGDDGNNHSYDDDAGYTQDGRMSSETPELHSDAVSDGKGDETHESGSESESASDSEDDSENKPKENMLSLPPITIKIPSISRKHEREITNNEETSRATSNTKKHLKNAKLASEMKKPPGVCDQAVRHNCGRPTKDATDGKGEVGGAPKRSGEEFYVSAVVEVQGEVIYVKGKTKCGDKFETPKPITLGPGPLTHKVAATWPDFLNFVAHLTKTIPKYLVTRSMTWRWLSNKNSTLPLMDNEGLATMINEIKA
ncbi:hypothetical protein BDN67DRAFT_1014230 [Paxillus ammoniavirescens]|nr:hypothetical protein BDN67DRAFT_1014230 [Paxillus ammoniavirescens]